MVLLSGTIQGTAAGEWISGFEGDTTILAGAGDDAIYDPFGANVIDGGSGNDNIVIYGHTSNDYQFRQLADGSILMEGPGLDGTFVSNRLFNVEEVHFDDGRFTLNELLGNSQPAPAAPQQQVQVQQQQLAQPAPTPVPTTPTLDLPQTSNTIFGTNAAEWLSGTDGNDTILAGGGDDLIYDPRGTNLFDGGDGIDTVVIYEGPRSSFVVQQLDDGSTELAGPGLDGTTVFSRLVNVERIAFLDGTVDISSGGDSTPNASAAEQGTAPVPEPTPQPAQESNFQDDGFGGSAQAFIPEPALASAASQSSSFADEVVRLTNVERARFGLEPLTVNQTLQQVAQDYSTTLAFGDFFSHTGLDGRLPWDRALDAGYNYQVIGENIAAGQLTPQQVVNEWLDSPSHRDNILNASFREIGIGYFVLENDTGDVNFNRYWTQLFGVEQ